MFQPPGFCQRSIATRLGAIAYYTAIQRPWSNKSTDTSDLSPDAASERAFSQIAASDCPTLVFLHGFGGGSSAFEWSKVYPAFATDYRILAPDLLGWGRSAHLARDYQIEDYLTTITEFLEQTCQSPTIVVASSLTAALTIRVAVERPDLFKALILTTPSGLSDFGDNYSRSFFAHLASTPILDRLLYNIGIATSAGIRTFLEQRQFAKPQRISEEIVAAYLESAQQPNAEYSALSFVRGDLSFDLARYITQLTTPTAILWGQKSQFTGPEIGRRLAELNPEAIKVLEILDEVGLTPQLELPAVTIGLIRKFIKMLNE